MFADTTEHSESLEETRWRVAAVVWAAGLVAVLVGWLLAAPVSAQAPPRDGTVFVHSAKSGKLGGGRLTLHGVSRRVTWAHHSGRSGVLAVKRLHRRVFSAETPAATGILHVAGHRGGDELTFKLSRPRYAPARRRVSYKVKRLGEGRLPSRAAQAAGAARRFAASSLTIQAAPQPSVDVQQNTYPCPADSSTTCWGTLSASGLPPGSEVTGFAAQVPGNTGQGVEIDVRVDGNGNVNSPLNLLCNNDYRVTNPNIGINATSVTASFSVSAPGSCG